MTNPGYIKSMVNLYDYMDYRQFLRDYMDAQKKERSWFSFRFFAGKLEMDNSNLVKIILGKRHVSARNTIKIIEVLKLNPKESQYFKTLVAFNKAKKQKDIKVLFDKLVALKNLELKKLQPHQYEYYQKWYHSAIFTLLDYYPFKGDYKALAKQLSPAITPEQAEESVTLMHKLGLIEKKEDGYYKPVNSMITSGENWTAAAVQEFQEETIKLSLHSLKNHSAGVHDIYTLTMGVSRNDMTGVQELIEEFRKSLIKLVSEGEKSDSVYQLNMQLFPMTRPKWKYK
jgi:uncharacterized protein (TIGR02147 family)